MCVCGWVGGERERERERERVRTHYWTMLIHVFVCVRVCVERERERERWHTIERCRYIRVPYTHVSSSSYDTHVSSSSYYWTHTLHTYLTRVPWTHVSSSSYDTHVSSSYLTHIPYTRTMNTCILLLIWHTCILLLIWHTCILLLPYTHTLHAYLAHLYYIHLSIHTHLYYIHGCCFYFFSSGSWIDSVPGSSAALRSLTAISLYTYTSLLHPYPEGSLS
jgi:hypothetical protein